MMKTCVFVTVTFALITCLPAKVVCRHLPTSNYAGINSASNSEIPFTNNQLIDSGLTHGIDIDLKTLTNINSHGVLNSEVPSPGTLIENNVLSGLGSHHGLAVDWPNTGKFNENYYTLSNYFEISPKSQFLVHLDAIPDFVLSPQESLFASSISDPRLLEMKTSVLQQPQETVQDILHQGSMFSAAEGQSIHPRHEASNGAHNTQESAFSPFAHEFSVADSNSVVNLPNTRTLVPDIKDQVLVNNDNSLTIHTGDTVNVDPNMALPGQGPDIFTNTFHLPKYMKTLPPLLIDVKNTGNKHQQHKLVKRSKHSTFAQTTEPPVNQHRQKRQTRNNGQTAPTVRNVQIREVLRHNLAPLTDIFGGESLFKPKAKIVTFFNLSPKIEALRRFAG